MNKFLINFSERIKQDFEGEKQAFFVLLVLLSIPFPYIVSTIAVSALGLYTLLYLKKEQISFRNYLLFPILLYFLMVLSFFWSIDKSLSLPALSKELSLLVIPVCFWLFGGISKARKTLVLKYYSYGILVFALYYLSRGTVRYFLTDNVAVFFYHELVTKDVNAIHVSVYMAMSFFWFLAKDTKKILDYLALTILLLMVLLLSSGNIIITFFGLIIIYFLFYAKVSKQMRLKNLIVMLVLLVSLGFIGEIKEQLRREYETIMTNSTVNDVISKEKNSTFFNVSIKQAWTKKVFNENDFFPGTAFRVYQFRIFLEMLRDDAIFWKGYGLNASYPKIEAKGLTYNVYQGNASLEGYQKKNFHNQYIQNFAELGVFGFLLLIIIITLTLKKAIQSKDFTHFAFAFLMISLFLTESFLWRQRGVVYFTMMYCLFNSGIAFQSSKTE
ncbi:hypothetical protein HKT18_02350 [Flavobacterium sp. IMCC34852]|uniref:O-antigen ligase-related domain-containing protein n=1 Tax=Flavobacterium rivulicola TaxID=2732161 RepID=A0A7Y3R829_9FLAO|nr:O-antigen ligase family protein [Flavobacterium sp. IMCC34852]NNT71047.1 hypothetical protein [Flavobacterium sp. IMCC34852]